MICCGNFKKKRQLHQDSLLRPVAKSEYHALDQDKVVLLDSSKVGIGKYSLFESVKKYPKLEKEYINSKERFYKKLEKEVQGSKRPDTRDAMILFHRDPDKLKTLILENELPFRLKWDCWMLMLMDQKYNSISEENFNILIKAKDHKVEDIVKKDVPRTFNDKRFFGEEVEHINVGREMLYKLCKAVGTYFKNIGYTQGFNFLAAFFLEVSGGSELESMNFAIQLLKNERFMLIGCFDDSFPLVYFLNFLFHKKLAKIDPEVAEAIKTLGLPDEVWLHKWFMSLFTGYFPVYFCSRVFDTLLATDIFIMVSIVVALVKQIRKAFLKDTKDFTYITGYLNDMGKSIEVVSSINSVIHNALKYRLEKDFLLTGMEAFSNSSHYSAKSFDRYARVFRKYLSDQNEVSQRSISVFNFDSPAMINPPEHEHLEPPRPIKSDLLKSRLDTIREESRERYSPSLMQSPEMNMRRHSNLSEINVQSRLILQPVRSDMRDSMPLNSPGEISEIPRESDRPASKQISSMQIKDHIFKHPERH